MRTNYHTHTTRCKHAVGSEREYIDAAVAARYDLLGFSDHSPWPFPDGFVSPIRMPIGELENYLASIRVLAREYVGAIEIKVGLECEYFPDYMYWLEARLTDTRFESRADYAIMGHHFDTNEINGAYFGGSADLSKAERYVKQVTAGMHTGLFACVAHPDLFLQRHSVFGREAADLSREICRASRETAVPLEYNLYGLRKQACPEKPIMLGYPNNPFWRVAAEEGCMTIVGVDAHDPAHLADPELGMLARTYLTNLGVNVIDTLNV